MACQKCAGIDDHQTRLALVRRIHEKLTPADVQFLEHCREPQHVSTLRVEREDLLWMLFYKLIAMTVDRADRVWIQTTATGIEMAKRRVA